MRESINDPFFISESMLECLGLRARFGMADNARNLNKIESGKCARGDRRGMVKYWRN